MRVAVATCAGDDVDVDSPLLLDALAGVGVAAELAVWDDPAVAWEGFDLTVVRSTWDYAPRRDEFLAWARARRRIVNRPEILEYSTDKHYLADLAARGYPVVPSHFCDRGATPVFPDGAFVVKPTVGAGSIDATRYRADEVDAARAHVARLHAAGRDALIQPYLDSVDSRGEHALVFIGGAFSHAMTKGAMLNVDGGARTALFRRERMSATAPDPDARAIAERVLADPRFADLLYARVDLLAAPEGWRILELELAEPSLFLTHVPDAAHRLARAVRSTLEA